MDPTAPDPALVSAITDAALRVIGTTGGGGLLAIVVGYLGREWIRERRREAGGDPEHLAKTETRQQIQAQGAALESISTSLEVTAKIQERMLRELEEMRRESREAHADLKADVRDLRRAT